MSEEIKQIEQIRQTFESAFTGFAHLRAEVKDLTLTDAENCQRELVELKTSVITDIEQSKNPIAVNIFALYLFIEKIIEQVVG